MMTLQNYDDSRILAFKLDGKIEEDDVEKFTEAFKSKTQKGKVHLLGEIDSMGGFEDLEAFTETIKMKGSALSDMDKIDKYAIITDKAWMEKLISIGNFLTPNLPIRLFHQDEKQLAINWLQQTVDKPYSPGIRPIELVGYENVLGFVINGKVKAKDYELINRKFEQQKQTHDKFHVYVEFSGFEDYTLGAFWEDFKTGINYYKHFHKVALLSHKSWLESATKVGDFISPGINLKFFNLDEKVKALDWLKD